MQRSDEIAKVPRNDDHHSWEMREVSHMSTSHICKSYCWKKSRGALNQMTAAHIVLIQKNIQQNLRDSRNDRSKSVGTISSMVILVFNGWAQCQETYYSLMAANQCTKALTGKKWLSNIIGAVWEGWFLNWEEQ
jgi:predicted ATPase